MPSSMTPRDEPTPGLSGDYEPPRIEIVQTADDLQREVQYGGIPISTEGPG